MGNYVNCKVESGGSYSEEKYNEQACTNKTFNGFIEFVSNSELTIWFHCIFKYKTQNSITDMHLSGAAK